MGGSTGIDQSQERISLGTIRRILTLKMEANDPGRIDQDVAAQLLKVHRTGTLDRAAFSKDQIQVSLHRRPTQYACPGPTAHIKLGIQLSLRIRDKTPGHFQFGLIQTDHAHLLERHNHDLDRSFDKFVLGLLQLQQVLAAGQSGQMAMEDQHQPTALIVHPPQRVILDILTFKIRAGFSDQVAHFFVPWLAFVPWLGCQMGKQTPLARPLTGKQPATRVASPTGTAVLSGETPGVSLGF